MQIRWFLGVLLALGLFLAVRTSAMTSANFGISWDSVNSGGDDSSSSTNFGLRDTLGEQATGFSSSTNFIASAGYRVGDEGASFLSFVIRDSSDTSNTNACSLGVLSTSAVSTCSYRLRIATNAPNGFAATIQADHDLQSASATMTNIGDNGAFIAGTEGYGIQSLTGASSGGFNGSSAYDQPVAEGAAPGFTFNVDASPIPTSTAVTFISFAAPFSAGSTPSLTNTTLVTHGAAIDTATPVGSYAQTVTYIVTASF